MSTQEHEAAAEKLLREVETRVAAIYNDPDERPTITVIPAHWRGPLARWIAVALADAMRVAREEDALRHVGSTDEHYCGVCDTPERNAVIRQRKLTAAIAQRAGEGDATPGPEPEIRHAESTANPEWPYESYCVGCEKNWPCEGATPPKKGTGR